MKLLLVELTGEDAVFGHFGATGGYALAARRAMHTFGTGPETWKHIAVGQRKWANLNPRAIMHEPKMTFDDYYNSRWVVEPFRLFDNCLVNDGGRAVVVTSAERAKDLRHTPVLIMGMGQHNPSGEIPQATIDACEIYDCFTYTVEITLQDYGFFEPGEGEDWFKDGTIEPGGKMPTNTSGGQLSEAYFMGLTPLSEAVMQLMGRCAERQLGPKTKTKEPEIILCSDNGGILQSHSCYILRRA